MGPTFCQRLPLRLAGRDEGGRDRDRLFHAEWRCRVPAARLRATEATGNIPVIIQSGRELSEKVILNLMREIRGHASAAYVLQMSSDPGALFGALQEFCGFERDGQLVR